MIIGLYYALAGRLLAGKMDSATPCSGQGYLFVLQVAAIFICNPKQLSPNMTMRKTPKERRIHACVRFIGNNLEEFCYALMIASEVKPRRFGYTLPR